MRRALVLVFVIIGVSSSILAQEAEVRGDAADLKGNPIPEVLLRLQNDSLGIDRTTKTKSNGQYSFFFVPPASGYVMTAEVKDYEMSAEVPPGSTKFFRCVTFALEVGQTRYVLPTFIGEKQNVPPTPLTRQPVFDCPKPGNGPQALAIPQPGNSYFLPQARVWSGRTQRAPLSSASFFQPASFVFTSGSMAPLLTTGLDEDQTTQDRNANSPAPPAQAPQSAVPAKQSPSTAQHAGTQTPPPAHPGMGELSRVPLDSISTAVSTVITSNQLRSLPFFNRNFLAATGSGRNPGDGHRRQEKRNRAGARQAGSRCRNQEDWGSNPDCWPQIRGCLRFYRRCAHHQPRPDQWLRFIRCRARRNSSDGL